MRRDVFERLAATLPARRVGQAEDVADGIIFLAGNSYVTGITLDVDGGMRVSAL